MSVYYVVFWGFVVGRRECFVIVVVVVVVVVVVAVAVVAGVVGIVVVVVQVCVCLKKPNCSSDFELEFVGRKRSKGNRG